MAVPAYGTRGTLILAEDGSYTDAVANGLVADLAAGETRIDRFTVESRDGTMRTAAS